MECSPQSIAQTLKQHRQIMNSVIAKWDVFLKKAEKKIKDGREKRNQNWLKEAPEFNVFKITRREHFEVTTHSALLANLLDPRESHGQRDLFLQSFLGCINGKSGKAAFNLEQKIVWEIEAEHSFASHIDTEMVHYDIDDVGNENSGRIDILLRTHDRSTAIAVENKIWAADQPCQLVRYWRFLNHYSPNRILVYLSPYGSKPSEAALETADSKEKKEILEQLICLSYKSDVRSMLKKVVDDIQAKPVQHIVDQYLKNLEAL